MLQTLYDQAADFFNFEMMSRYGWRLVGGTRLFRLAAKADARAAFERLMAAGILARPFANAPDWLRFGIPGDENAWRRLAGALLE